MLIVIFEVRVLPGDYKILIEPVSRDLGPGSDRPTRLPLKGLGKDITPLICRGDVYTKLH